jgi:hypothetical protein
MIPGPFLDWGQLVEGHLAKNKSPWANYKYSRTPCRPSTPSAQKPHKRLPKECSRTPCPPSPPNAQKLDKRLPKECSRTPCQPFPPNAQKPHKRLPKECSRTPCQPSPPNAQKPDQRLPKKCTLARHACTAEHARWVAVIVPISRCLYMVSDILNDGDTRLKPCSSSGARFINLFFC